MTSYFFQSGLAGKKCSIVLLTGYAQTGEIPVVGHNSILPKEHGAKFFNLPIVRYLNKEVGAVATWDSSIHDSTCLNTVTPGKISPKPFRQVFSPIFDNPVTQCYKLMVFQLKTKVILQSSISKFLHQNVWFLFLN